ncbi:Hypothetical Protein FCC1311_036762 [Hondaea fermentalgiana]|uniref:Uncharacterized protein n=1 Tax=Hondaea fermentalgiana TaxID=2315210 RepID=A0A2R5GA50_9STRA|nr:Hypothetical Protein FCC1311_036762 [Hondaea fermentalgiana]|eukprot:GBG27455.1 Hypothetical Protein FCC1311_036762 [Hondaea fermentalgiana]
MNRRDPRDAQAQATPRHPATPALLRPARRQAQIPNVVLYEEVVPLHQLERTSIIGISTITSEDNFFTKNVEQKNLHGELLFAVTNIHLACKPCRDKDEAHKCNHNAHLLPAWSSKRKRKILNAIMRGEEEMLAREIGGVASALHQRAFPTKLINQFANMERLSVPYNETYDHVFHSIDPAAAGKQLEIGITSPHHRTRESTPLGHPLLQHNVSVLIVESNLGMESDHMAKMHEENIGYFVVMHERDDGIHTGFRTTHNMKMLAVENFREKIMDGAVRIANPDPRGPEKLTQLRDRSYRTLCREIRTKLASIYQPLEQKISTVNWPVRLELVKNDGGWIAVKIFSNFKLKDTFLIDEAELHRGGDKPQNGYPDNEASTYESHLRVPLDLVEQRLALLQLIAGVFVLS